MTDYLETADSNETIFLATFLVTFLTRDMVNTGKVKNLLRKTTLFGCLNYSLLIKILAFLEFLYTKCILGMVFNKIINKFMLISRL